MQAVAGNPTGSRDRPEPGRLLVPIGTALMLIGVVGDLVVRTVAPAQHANEPLIALRLSGTSPWHLVLFAGMLTVSLGAIRWASRIGTEFGNLLGAMMTLLLAAATVLGLWSGWQVRTGQTAAAASGPAGGTAAIAAAGPGGVSADLGHVHGATSVDGAGDVLAGSGAEGASILGHSHGTPGVVSPQEAQIMARQLDAAKKATARYRDIARAKADGYFQVTQFIPGLGLHLANLKISNTVFDPAHPQVLLYQPDANGTLELVGVAYSIAHTGPNDEQPAGFAGNADAWHYHQNLCFLPGGTVTITPDRVACRSRHGYFQARTAWLLHAWIWKSNPDGVFTEYNPKVF